MDAEDGDRCGPSGGAAATGSETTAAAPGGSAASSTPGSNAMDKRQWFELMPSIVATMRARGTEVPPALTMPRCSMCRQSGDDTPLAEIKCLQQGCSMRDRAVCDACFSQHHPVLSHRTVDITKCRQCQLDRVAFWCSSCDLVFCDACFLEIHDVRKARNHIKVAVEGASGKMLAKGNWSSQFHSAIMQELANHRRPYAKDATTPQNDDKELKRPLPEPAIVNGKRKRENEEIEVITIDSDDDDGAGPSDERSHMSGVKRMNNAPLASGSVNSTSIPPSSAREIAHQLQSLPLVPRPNAMMMGGTTPLGLNTPLPEPIPFPPELAASAPFGPAHATNSSTAPVMTTPAQPASSMPNIVNVGSTGFSAMPIQTTMMDVSNDTSAGWSSSSMTMSAMAMNESFSMAGLPPTINSSPDSMMDADPLTEAMNDRYDKTNAEVFQLERKIYQLNQSVSQAVLQGPYAAAPIMVELPKVKKELMAAQIRRDKLFVLFIMRSPSVLQKVRSLQLTELSDVAQVPALSHRKCLQLALNISVIKSTLRSLNEQLAMTISSSGMAACSVVNSTIQQLSSSIKYNETQLRQLRDEQEVEFVRIVQYSERVRNLVKQEFLRSQHQQHQQQQQQQQQQQHQQQQFY